MNKWSSGWSSYIDASEALDPGQLSSAMTLDKPSPPEVWAWIVPIPVLPVSSKRVSVCPALSATEGVETDRLCTCQSFRILFQVLFRFCFQGYTSRINGEGNGTPLQYSCLENPMDGGTWRAAVHGVTECWTRLSDFTFTFHFHALEKEMATPLQCSCLENLRDRGAWWAAVYGVPQSRTRLKWLSSNTYLYIH